MIGFLTRSKRIARTVEAALSVLIGDLLSHPVEAAAAFKVDPDAALRLALAQAFRVTGVKLDPREAARAIGKMAMIARLDELRPAADKMVANMERLRAKHEWLK